MATASGTTPSELLIDINNTIRRKDQPNTITPETHSNLLDNMVKVLSGSNYSDIVSYESGKITFVNPDSTTYEVTGFYTGSTEIFVTGGTYNENTGELTLTDNLSNDSLISGFFTGVTISNTLFVDENGDDSTGQKGRLDKPFKTLNAARNAASSGDTVYVFPQIIEYDNRDSNSNYWNSRADEVNLWKDGVRYYFSLGVKIIIRNQTITGAKLALFNPEDTINETCIVDGYLEYEQYGYGTDTFNGETSYFRYENTLGGGCTFKSTTKSLTSWHSEIYRITTYTTAAVNVFDYSEEQVWYWLGVGQTGSGGAYIINGQILDSTVNFTSDVKIRNFASSKAYSFYIRSSLENSKINIYGDYMYSYSNLLYLRQLYCHNINVNIKNIDYYYAYVPFALTGSILSTGSNGGTWTLNLKGDLNDYQNNSITGLGLFYLQTGDGCVVNYEGNINTKTNSGVGRFIVGNNSNNCIVNLKGEIDLMGTGTTSNIILQAYSSGSETNFTGKIKGNYSFLAHPRLGGKVIINNSNISSTAEDFKMLDHTDTTTSTFRLDNTRIEGKNDVGTFADGQYLNVLINNSNIINTGSGDTMSNITDFGILQTLNSTIYSNSGLSINYPTLSDVISSNTVVNTDYSATTLSGEITKLTNLIN